MAHSSLGQKLHVHVPLLGQFSLHLTTLSTHVMCHTYMYMYMTLYIHVHVHVHTMRVRMHYVVHACTESELSRIHVSAAV